MFDKKTLDESTDVAIVPVLSGNGSYANGTIDKIEDDPANQVFFGSSITDSYRLKSELVGQCMEQIGMGRFQWGLFVVCGIAGMVDNFWTQGIGTIQPVVVREFSDVSRVTFSSIAFYAGLIVGASFWGISSDFMGRKPAFNMTVLFGGVFALAVGSVNHFVGFCVIWSIIGTAAGGNVPVDNMLFLEYLPGSHQYLLTALAVWWLFGQLVVSLVGWGFIASYTCSAEATPATCTKGENVGWRYIMFTLGAITVAFVFLRILLFKIPESPRYLLSKNRDAEAVEAVNYVARFNRKPEPLTLAMLQQIDHSLGIASQTTDGRKGLTRKQILKENLADFKTANVRRLFATRRLGQHTTIIWLIWLTIGIAYPLYFNFLPTYLSQKFVDNSYSSLDTTYRNYCITSAVGMAAPPLAAMLIQTRFGRRYIMGISSVATGALLFAYTAARSPAASLAFTCVSGFVGNFEYGILFAYTPESFPAPHRGLACGLASTLQRIGGLCAALIGTYTNFTTVPIYVAAAMWIGVGLASFVLPFETHHHAAI
ncbi:uncharacterized protein Z519_02621 [Cladophialophora bantiana CBS 173.52]|uniref:Major facilitator superfamily (MFS) profile domain-containing protein n=1 Tax=Cladophialophora bantiana (strain ATCC 10958 / CBS 173.52 / CDC B-1940 / NIH 8579) TaxID=1442370 RepID=A0A0D2IK85_CLAB1|nr:uncharacterized protein Z519_02621 [Cladophialophora bantiana CBS 173.52]KIW97229.1 hypothetical protein Z519_02621 [Cladophialophora bantiana CBS 173.52]